MQASNLVAGAADPTMGHADIVFGQPDPVAVIASPRVKWIHLTSAGYDRYDRPDLRAALKERGGLLTNSGGVYLEPCAEHVMAMLMSVARQLPQSQDTQRADRAWPTNPRRIESFLLTGQTLVILSYGTIARRLIELLAPFKMRMPGSSEAAVLVDLDGDGKPEFLPNATNVVVWYSGWKNRRREARPGRSTISAPRPPATASARATSTATAGSTCSPPRAGSRPPPTPRTPTPGPGTPNGSWAATGIRDPGARRRRRRALRRRLRHGPQLRPLLGSSRSKDAKGESGLDQGHRSTRRSIASVHTLIWADLDGDGKPHELDHRQARLRPRDRGRATTDGSARRLVRVR